MKTDDSPQDVRQRTRILQDQSDSALSLDMANDSTSGFGKLYRDIVESSARTKSGTPQRRGPNKMYTGGSM